MDRRAFIGCTGVGLVGLALAARAQQPGRIYPLGVLAPGTQSGTVTGLLHRLGADMRLRHPVYARVKGDWHENGFALLRPIA